MKQFLITRCIKVALLVLVCIIVGCDKDEPSDKLELSDKVEIINMYVSAETGTYKPAGSETTIECMLVKEEGELEYSNLPFGSIEGFDYVRGHENMSWKYVKPHWPIHRLAIRISHIRFFAL